MMAFATDIQRLRRSDGVQDRRALVIGVSEYEDKALRLPFCVADATRLEAVLKNRGYQVTALHDPSSAAVEPALRALVDGADEDDLLLFYFSGHGTLVDNRPYLVLADTPNTDEGLAQRGVPLARVLEILRGLPRWVVVFLDACHMGADVEPHVSVEPDVGKSTSHGVQRDGGFALLSGSTTMGITQDTDGAGVFSRWLIGGLEGEAADPDGGVQFSTLAQHVQRGVASWRTSPQGRAKLSTQMPVLRLEMTDLPLLPPNDYIELYPAATQGINAAAFSPSGHRLATACQDGSVRLSDPVTGQPLLEIGPLDGWPTSVAFEPTGRRFASLTNAATGTIRLWNVADGSLFSETPLATTAAAIAWSPDGRSVAVASADGLQICAADALGRLDGPRALAGHDGAVQAVAFAPDGQLISGGADGTARIWNTATGECLAVLPHDGPVLAVASSPDGRMLATGGSDGTASPALVNVPRVWNRATRDVAARLAGHTGAVSTIAFAPDGNRVATAGQDGRARVWSVGDGHLLRELTVEVPHQANPPEVHAVVFAPRGDRLFVGFADGRGRLYQLAPPAR
jgi:WD40 repeat protein